MNDIEQYSPYLIVVVGGADIALWAGIPPFLLVALTCPLMMFVMMRGGMQGGPDRSHGRIDRP